MDLETIKRSSYHILPTLKIKDAINAINGGKTEIFIIPEERPIFTLP